MKNQRRLTLGLAALFLLLCLEGALATKSQAPVELSGVTGEDRANLVVTFRADAEDVEITTWGTGALKEEMPPNVTRRKSVKKGEKITLNVSFRSPNGPASVGFSVSGDFGGMRLAKVTGFGVGSATATKPAVQQDSEGRNIIVHPAKLVE